MTIEELKAVMTAYWQHYYSYSPGGRSLLHKIALDLQQYGLAIWVDPQTVNVQIGFNPNQNKENKNV
jgi:hypothetical protein